MVTMPFKEAIGNFFRKYISRKFLGSTILAPMIVSYGLAHGWPPEIINHLLIVLGIGIGSLGAVDVVNANRGFKRED